MKRLVIFFLLVIVCFVPLGHAPVAQAQGQSLLLYLPVLMMPVTAVDIDPIPQVGNGMLDVWVFVDADLNGVYSAGDTGLSDALVCIRQDEHLTGCVGTDEGDTWWEGLRSGLYSARIDPASLPAGHALSSIRCEETGSREEYRGCRHNLDEWTSLVRLGETTRLNIFFALAP